MKNSKNYWTLEMSREFWDERDRLTNLFICNRPVRDGSSLCRVLVRTNLGCWRHRTPVPERRAGEPAVADNSGWG